MQFGHLFESFPVATLILMWHQHSDPAITDSHAYELIVNVLSFFFSFFLYHWFSCIKPVKQHKAVHCMVSVPSCCLLRDCWRLLRPIWLMLATLVQDKATGRGQRQPHQASTSVVFRKAVVCPRITVCYQGTATDWSNLKEKSHSGVTEDILSGSGGCFPWLWSFLCSSGCATNRTE